jgi:hypothetical protein
VTTGARTDVSEIGPLAVLGSGGQGTVFSTSRSLKQPAVHLVYKEYNARVSQSIDYEVLASMAAFLEGLPMTESLEFLSHAAWPCLIVETAGATSGFLMPAIPDGFFMDMTLASGSKRVLGEFQYLLNSESFLARQGINLNDKLRYGLLRSAAEALVTLHSNQIAVGDLSDRNLMFSLTPNPAVFFIQCDAMRFHGQSVTGQCEASGWVVGAINPGEELATEKTDSLKLGLLALRLMAGDQTTWDMTAIPKSVPAAVRDLIIHSLDKRPGHRPNPAAWVGPLTQATNNASTKMPDQ